MTFFIWFSQFFLRLINKNSAGRVRHLAKRFMYEAFIRLQLLALLELLLCPSIYMMGDVKDPGSTIMAIISYLLALLLIANLTYILTCNVKKFTQEVAKDNDPVFFWKYGTYFDMLRKKGVKGPNKWTINYYGIFVLRRILFVAILLAMRNRPGNQL